MSLNGSRIGTPSYLGRNLFEVVHQRSHKKSGNMHPMHATNAHHGHTGQSVGCKPCQAKCAHKGGDVSGSCPACQHKH